jgi:hypothetical protein
MLEIPGEEAPTDPGLQARQRKEAEDKVRARAQRKKSRFLGAGAVVLIGMVGVAAVWSYQAQQSALTYEMDDYYVMPLSELAVAADPVAPEAAPSPNTAAAVHSPRAVRTAPTQQVPTFTNTGPEGGIASGPKSASGGLPEDDTRRPSMMPVGEGGTSSVGAADIQVDRFASERVLTDDQEIYDMAKRVINLSSPQLQSCYNQRLKMVEGLKGAWELTFSIATDGSTKGVRASGVNGSDTELESCIVRSVGAWHFQKVTKVWGPIHKTYRFGASM